MTYHKSNDRVSSELFSDREGESPAVSSPRFRQETNFPRELRFENKVENDVPARYAVRVPVIQIAGNRVVPRFISSLFRGDFFIY